MKSIISVVVIAKNEGAFIHDCLESVKWANEIILLDGGSTDKTLEIAKTYPSVKIRTQRVKTMNYGAWHSQGLEESGGDWILYLDADERVNPLLKEEILEVIKEGKHSAYAIPRRNFLLGKELCFGGWYPDYQIRLFRRDKLKKWVGDLHEHAEFEGSSGKLECSMIHLQPNKIEPALEKSIGWSDIEANLLFKSNHPPISWWRVFRMGLTVLFDRLVKKQGFRDGREGWIESIYQSFHTMIVYMKLWELQTNKRNNNAK